MMTRPVGLVTFSPSLSLSFSLSLSLSLSPSHPKSLLQVLADLSVIDHSLEGTQQTLLPDMLGAARVSVLSPEAGTLSTAEVSFPGLL